MAISDDGIDWNAHWKEHVADSDFKSGLEYLKKYLPENFSVLDIGCGSCKFYPALKAIGCNQYVGVDSSKIAMEQANKKFSLELGKSGYSSFIFILAEASMIDFEGRFDLVLSNTFLQHTNIETKKKLLPKVQKSLKTGGILAIREKSDVETPTTFTVEGWIKFICNYGFELIKDFGADGLVFRRK
jgi:ubiquinone/menaquinone biosynthesis C-methylase UbiE